MEASGIEEVTSTKMTEENPAVMITQTPSNYLQESLLDEDLTIDDDITIHDEQIRRSYQDDNHDRHPSTIEFATNEDRASVSFVRENDSYYANDGTSIASSSNVVLVAYNDDDTNNNDNDAEGIEDKNDEDEWDILTRNHNNTMDTIDWDVVSSVKSVMSMDNMSFHTSTMHNQHQQRPTYSSVVANRVSPNKSSSHHNNTILMTPKSLKVQTVDPSSPLSSPSPVVAFKTTQAKLASNMKKVEEEKCLDDFDCHDDRDGYKFGRGGKHALMFRGNPHHKGQGRRRASPRQNYRKVNTRNSCY